MAAQPTSITLPPQARAFVLSTSGFFVYKWIFWFLVIDVLLLGYIGANKPEGAYLIVGRAATLYYFFHFVVLAPLLGKIERPLPLPTSFAEGAS